VIGCHLEELDGTATIEQLSQEWLSITDTNPKLRQ
jgi:hypothetical protein